MANTMRAALAYSGETRLRLEDIAIPEIADDEVLVRIKSTGLTHGILDIWQTHPELMKVYPTIIGPQMAGYVARVGKDVRGLKEGDRTFVWPIVACGRCDSCQNNEEPECDAASLMGHAVFSEAGLPLYTRYHNGGLAEYVRAPAWNVEKLPDNVSFRSGAFIMQACVAYRAFLKAGASQGSTVVLNAGTGMTGALAIRLAPAFGISKLIVVSRTPESFRRLDEVSSGAFDPLVLSLLPAGWQNGDTLTQQLKAMNGGRPVDCVVDLSPVGSEMTVPSMMAMRRGGTMVIVGGSSDTISLPYHKVMVNGYGIKGTKAGTRTIARKLVRLLESGQLDFEALFTHSFGLEDANTVADYINERIDKPLMIDIAL